MPKRVRVRDLDQIHGINGKVMHMLRADDPAFSGFGEIYFSTIHPGAIKAWHKHSVKTVNLAVIAGLARIAVFDPDDGAASFIVGPENYKLVTIPPGIWYGFQCAGPETAVIADCADRPFEPGEQANLPWNAAEIPFDWEK